MRLQRHLFTGVLTLIPLWVTWLVFKAILGLLSNLGRPAVRSALSPFEEQLPEFLASSWFQSGAAIILTLLLVTVLGWLTSKVVGRRFISAVETIIERVPVAQQIYRATKKLVSALNEKPSGAQRVVLIEFPHPGMKTVGLVMKTLTDEVSGEPLAAVYVPTTPNPTSGYLEIVPVSAITNTNWTMEEAMSFVISGGAVSREKIHYGK